VLAQKRECPHRSACEERAALVHGICRLAVHDDVLRRAWIYEHLREGEDRLLRAVRRDELRLGIELDAEPARAPAGSGRAELREAGGERIRRPLGYRLDERFAD